MRRVCVVTSLLVSLLLIAGTTMGAADKPSFDLNWYGHFKLDGSFDQNLTSYGDYVMWVEPRPVDKVDIRTFKSAGNSSLICTAVGQGIQSVRMRRPSNCVTPTSTSSPATPSCWPDKAGT
jgi:hypothetical protein